MEVVNSNGKISALFVAGVLLGGDIFFFNDDELPFDGNSHSLAGIQFNAATQGENPYIEDNIEVFVNGVAECMMYVEESESLKIDLSAAKLPIHRYFHNENITGITIMNLFCEGLLKLAESTDKTVILLVDTRLINAIPDFLSKAQELMKIFCDYDGINYKYDIREMNNFDV